MNMDKEVEMTNYDGSEKKDKAENDISLEDSGRILDPYRNYKIGKTTCLSFCWLSLGMIMAMTSPTLPDLRDNLGATMEQMSIVVGVKNIGIIFGCLTGSMLADRYRGQADLIESMSFFLSGVAAIAKPYANSLPLLGVMFVLDGLGHGSLDPVGSTMVLWMWGDASGPPMYAMFLGAPIGQTLAPLLAFPFLGPQDDDTISTLSYTLPTTAISMDIQDNTSIPSVTTSVPEAVSRIQIPYGIMGGYTLLMGLIFLIYYFVGLPTGMELYGEPKTKLSTVISPSACSKFGTTGYTMAVIILLSIYYIFFTGTMSTMDIFVFSYVVDSGLPFTTKEAALLDTAYRSSGIAGMTASVLLSKFLPCQVVFFSCVILNAGFAACLAFLGTDKKSYIWIFLCFFKFTGEPMWPSGLLWAAEYVTVDSMVVAFFMIAYGLGGFFFSWLTGYLYDTFSPESVAYVSMSCAFAMVVTLTISQLAASLCPGKKGRSPQADIISVQLSSNEEKHVYKQNIRMDDHGSEFTKL